MFTMIESDNHDEFVSQVRRLYESLVPAPELHLGPPMRVTLATPQPGREAPAEPRKPH